MINIRDEADVQIWCDYQEETKQTSADFFLRLRFAKFLTFMANASHYCNRDGWGLGYGWSDGNGEGNGYGWDNGYGNGHVRGFGYGWDNGNGNGDGDVGNGKGDGIS